VVLVCHDISVKTWSQGTRNIPGDENKDYLAVAFQGDFAGPGHPGGEPTSMQMAVALHFWFACRDQWPGWDEARIFGHFDFGKPACPGSTLEAMIRSIRCEFVSNALRTNESRQQALQQFGFYTGAIDGVWGPESRAALVVFQRHHDLEVDGIWGPMTTAAMLAALENLT